MYNGKIVEEIKMTITNKIITNIIGKTKKRGGKNDWDGDGVPNKKDCQPRNTMRQDNLPFISNQEQWDIHKAKIDEKI